MMKQRNHTTDQPLNHITIILRIALAFLDGNSNTTHLQSSQAHPQQAEYEAKGHEYDAEEDAPQANATQAQGNIRRSNVMNKKKDEATNEMKERTTSCAQESVQTNCSRPLDRIEAQ
eukprot:260251_1